VPGILYNIPVSSGTGQRQNLVGWGATHSFAHIPNAGWAAFAFSVSFTAFCFLPVWILYRKRIFLKV